MLVDKSQNRGNLKITMGASITSLKLSPDVFERESFAENKFTHWVVSVYVKIYSRVMRHLPKAKPGSVYSAGKTGVATFSILPGVSCLGWLATMQLRATDSKSFWISGAQWTNSCVQNLKVGFLISSMKVIRSPQGWGLFTINLSNSTLVICSWIASVLASAKR